MRARWPAHRRVSVAHALANSSSVLATHKIGMCGYTAISKDGHTYSHWF